MVRTFLAINLPDREKQRLSQAVEMWRRYRAPVRWTALSRLHLTLKFIGEVKEERIEAIAESCQKVAESYRPFDLKTTVTGVFPTPKRPRILWVGLASVEDGALHALQKDIEARLEMAGFPKEEKPFSPHITVGRVKGGRNMSQLMRDFMNVQPSGHAFTCNSFVLYSSTLTPKGPIYRELERFNFRNG